MTPLPEELDQHPPSASNSGSGGLSATCSSVVPEPRAGFPLAVLWQTDNCAPRNYLHALRLSPLSTTTTCRMAGYTHAESATQKGCLLLYIHGAAAVPALVYAECSCDVTSVLLFREEAPCLQEEEEKDEESLEAAD
ncbi:hypothetical protein FQA47_018063 [Oryzias melastigma]|uniref:Uncharacterized protein n=1 Tax=Oryzias melastigma TaxID=30732 RepID=A0A834C4B6_ORYME|nr:hypothetical protein FQA47_018063 [Oryzias melastigma]